MIFSTVAGKVVLGFSLIGDSNLANSSAGIGIGEVRPKIQARPYSLSRRDGAFPTTQDHRLPVAILSPNRRRL